MDNTDYNESNDQTSSSMQNSVNMCYIFYSLSSLLMFISACAIGINFILTMGDENMFSSEYSSSSYRSGDEDD